MNRPLIETPEDRWNILFSILFLLGFLVLAFILGGVRGFPIRIDLFDFFLIAAATYRLTRLFTHDKITRFIREYFRASTSFGRTVYEVMICSWCTSIWMALLTVGIYYLIPSGWLLLLILAVSGIASFFEIITSGVIRFAEKSSVEKMILEKDLSVRESSGHSA